MRRLMAMLAIVCASAAMSTTSWALFGLENVSYDGSLEVSGNSANNETDFGNDPAGALTSNDHRGRTATRVRVGMNAQVTDKVMGRLELIRTPRQYGTAVTTVAGEEGTLAFHNAYVEISELWDHTFRLGRQYVGNAGDLVWNISPRDDDSLTANSIDGLSVECKKYDFIHGNIFTGKATEDDALAGTDAQLAATGDVNLTSIDLIFPELVPSAKVNLGYLLGDDSNTQAESDNNRLRTIRAGINGGASENMFTYRAELFANSGEFQGAGLTASGATKLKYEGTALDLGAGYNSPETSVGTFGAWINYLMASGDDNVRDDKDESFHDFTPLGFNTSDRLLGEIFGKSNTLSGGATPRGQGINTADSSGSAPSGATQGQGLNVFNIGASLKPSFSKQSTFRVDFYTFARAEDSVKTSTATGATNLDVGDKFGTELDLAYIYDHTENVNIELGYAMLMPDDALVGGVVGFPVSASTNKKDDTITKLYARTKIKWGGSAQ